MTMSHRNVRVSDDVWEAAKAKAEANGTTPSKLIRQWLADYVAADAPAPDQIVDDLKRLIAEWERSGKYPMIVQTL